MLEPTTLWTTLLSDFHGSSLENKMKFCKTNDLAKHSVESTQAHDQETQT